jgi:hypothetical protein
MTTTPKTHHLQKCTQIEFCTFKTLLTFFKTNNLQNSLRLCNLLQAFGLVVNAWPPLAPTNEPSLSMLSWRLLKKPSLTLGF